MSDFACKLHMSVLCELRALYGIKAKGQGVAVCCRPVLFLSCVTRLCQGGVGVNMCLVRHVGGWVAMTYIYIHLISPISAS